MRSRSSLHLATAVAAAATLLPAQGDYDLDKLTPGTLGATLSLQVTNAPGNALLLVMPSFNGGPTPIAAFDPGDPRVVQVGNDVAFAWFVTPTSPAGTATITVQLPNRAVLQDSILHWQTLTAPGAVRLVDRISNKVVTQSTLAGVATPATASLGAARAFAAGFFNRSFNAGAGDVVVAGGGTGTLTAATGLASTEIWDFRTMTRRAGPNMTSARALHLAVPLTDGRVLVIGGADATGNVLATCEIYNPTTNTFTATGSMAVPRTMHAACRLPDGRVMVAGGTSSLVDTTAAITNTQNTVEIYNPATGTWANGPNIGGRRLAPALTLLANNRVMVSGGVEVTLFLGLPIAAVSTRNVQLYNPGTNTWSAGAQMVQGRAGHHYNQVTLSDGRVLMTGGTFVSDLLNAANATPTQGAEVYNPATNTWTAANMQVARALHSANLLPDGRVVVCGGAQGTLTTPFSIADVEVFDPSSNSWQTLAPLGNPRGSHAAAMTPDGTLLLFGGQGSSTTTTSIETLRF